MARFSVDPSRVNFSVIPRGKEYNLRVLERAQSVFANLLNLLPSNYISAVQGPNYTIELKAVAVELAKIELALEDVDLDRDNRRTRSEFLYTIEWTGSVDMWQEALSEALARPTFPPDGWELGPCERACAEAIESARASG